MLATREFKARPATKEQEAHVAMFYYYYIEQGLLTDDDSLMYEHDHDQWVEIEVTPTLTDCGWFFNLEDVNWRPTGFSTGKKGLEAYENAIQKAFDGIDWTEVFINHPVYDIR